MSDITGEAPGLPIERLKAVPSGAQVEVTDPALLTEEQYAVVARITCGYRPTEYGNAQRLAALFGDDLRWVVEEKQWYVWGGQRWAPDTTGELMRRAKTVARLLLHEVSQVERIDRDAWFGHWKRTETKRGLQAMIDLAASERIVTEEGRSFTLACSVDDFDRDKELLNCANGTLNLTTGVLTAHRREDLQRRVTLVGFDPDRRSAEWEQFLLDCTGGDPELVDYLQLLAGATLLGYNRHDVLPVIFGPPGSGKSTFIQALLAPLGPQYGDSAALETFSEQRATSAAKDDLARLEGLRMVACVEGERNHTLAAALVKRVTGGDAIAARRLYKTTRTWLPEFILWLAVNERPPVHRDEEGVMRRIKFIPFENQVVDVDPTLRERLSDLQTTSPAVLTWAVTGARRLTALQGPLIDPPVVTEALEEYREEVRPSKLDAWLQDCCVAAGDHVRTPVEKLRLSYETWCRAAGVIPMGAKAWGTDMGQNYKRARTAKTRYYRGVELVPTGPSSTP